jgi:hypothetical protein
MTSSPKASCREAPLASVDFPCQLHSLLQLDRDIAANAAETISSNDFNWRLPSAPACREKMLTQHIKNSH